MSLRSRINAARPYIVPKIIEPAWAKNIMSQVTIGGLALTGEYQKLQYLSSGMWAPDKPLANYLIWRDNPDGTHELMAMLKLRAKTHGEYSTLEIFHAWTVPATTLLTTTLPYDVKINVNYVLVVDFSTV